MKLIKKINRIVEDVDADLVADLDQENVIKDDKVIADNIKEVDKKAKEDESEIKKINGKQPEDPKPIKEDMADAVRKAEEIRAQAEVEVANLMANATAEEMQKQAELDALAKENLLTDLLAGITKSIWDLVDAYQSAITSIKANDIEDAEQIADVLNEIVSDEYIHIGTLQGLTKHQIEDFADKSLEGEAEISKDVIADTVDDNVVDDEIDDELTLDTIDDEPDPIENVDEVDFHDTPDESELSVQMDGEPQAIEVSDDDLQ